MKRSTIKRKTPLARSGRVNPLSAKRKDRAWKRNEVKRIVEKRDGQCRAIGILGHDCSLTHDIHELIPRSAWGDGIYEPANCILICRTAHDWVGGNRRSAARVGLHVTRATVDRFGHDGALVEAFKMQMAALANPSRRPRV